MSKRFLPLMACLVVVLAGCNDSSTTVVDLDCGLVYTDLRTDWVVNYASTVNTSLALCDDLPLPSAYDGDLLDVTLATYTYTNVQVTANGVGFQVTGDIDVSAPASELVADVAADTCLAFVQIWENDDNAYVQCIGTLTRSTGIIYATCDSAAVSSAGDGIIDATCDLNASFNATIAIAP